MTPYYEDASVTIYLGDCREVVPALDLGTDHRVDLVLTDPPYGDTSLAWDRWPREWPRIVASVARQVWCFASMRMLLDHAHEFEDARFQYAQEVVWGKQNGSSFAADRFKRVHEFATHWYRGQWGSLTINPQKVERLGPNKGQLTARRDASDHLGKNGLHEWTDDGTRFQQSIIYVQSMHQRAIHPTEKPIGILAPLIAYSTNPGDLILDPFAGSCSTARAARSLGRRSICIEANEQYLEAAVKALAQGDLFAEMPA